MDTFHPFGAVLIGEAKRDAGGGPQKHGDVEKAVGSCDPAVLFQACANQLFVGFLLGKPLVAPVAIGRNDGPRGPHQYDEAYLGKGGPYLIDLESVAGRLFAPQPLTLPPGLLSALCSEGVIAGGCAHHLRFEKGVHRFELRGAVSAVQIAK